MELTDDELHNLDDSMCGYRECAVPFARAAIAADRELQAHEIAATDALLRQALEALHYECWLCNSALSQVPGRTITVVGVTGIDVNKTIGAITKHLEQKHD